MSKKNRSCRMYGHVCEPHLPVDPRTIDFILFDDPNSDFSTLDVRDIDGEIGRFDVAKERMICGAGSPAFDGCDVEETGCTADSSRFGWGRNTADDRRTSHRPTPATICDIVVQDGMPTILRTDVAIPQD